MALIFRFIRNDNSTLIADTPAISAQFNFALNKAADWTATFPVNTVAMQQIEKGDLVEARYNGELILEGYVVDLGKSYELAQSVTVKGRDSLDFLFSLRGNTKALYDDVVGIHALDDLLRQGGWRLGYRGTFVDETRKISVDLKNEKQLASQFQKLLKEIGSYYYKPGRVIDGIRTVDVGKFGENSYRYFFSPPNGYEDNVSTTNIVKSFKETSNGDEYVHLLEVAGGNYTNEIGGQTQIQMREALIIAPELFNDPEYPIVELLNVQKYAILRRNVGNIGGVLRAYSGLDPFLMGRDAGAAYLRPIITFRAMPGTLEYIDVWSNGARSYIIGNMLLVIKETDETNVTQAYASNPNPILAQITIPGAELTQFDKKRFRFDFRSFNLMMELGKRYSLYFDMTDLGMAAPTTLFSMYCNAGPQTMFSGFRLDRVGTDLKYAPVCTITTKRDAGLVITSQERVEVFTQYAPAKSETLPPSLEIRNSALALYRRGVEYLKSKAVIRKTYDLEAVGNSLTVPLGQKIYVDAYAESAYTDQFNQTPTIYRSRIKGLFTVESFSLDFKDNSLTGKYKIFDGEDIELEDSTIDLYEKSANDQKQKLDGAPIKIIDPGFVVTTTIDIVGVAANSTLSDGTPCHEYSWTPTPPSGQYTWFSLVGIPVIITNSGFVPRIELSDWGDSGVVKFKVSVNRNWGGSDTMSLKASVAWR